MKYWKVKTGSDEMGKKKHFASINTNAEEICDGHVNGEALLIVVDAWIGD